MTDDLSTRRQQAMINGAEPDDEEPDPPRNFHEWWLSYSDWMRGREGVWYAIGGPEWMMAFSAWTYARALERSKAES